MTNALGPVVGNRFDDERVTQLKPHLMERLVANTVRAVPLGTMVTEDDGRMAFVPNYTHTTERVAPKAVSVEGARAHTFKPGDKVRVMATVEQLMGIYINEDLARELTTGLVGTVYHAPSSMFPVCAKFGHLAGEMAWGFRLDMVRLVEAEGDDEREAMAGFDPMTEPLQIGDYVEVVFRGDGVGVKETGKRGKVVRIHHLTGVALAYDDGTEDTGPGWGNRSSLKLLARKATS